MSWMLDVKDLTPIAIGASILGTGGGGDPYIGQLMAQRALEQYGPVKVLEADDIAGDDWVIAIAGMGAPTVLFEKPPHGDEPVKAFLRLEKHLGISNAIPCPIEAGGINSLIPIVVAAQLNRPIVDADGMGRAFPELYMVTFHVGGLNGTPACIANEFGDYVILDHLHDNLAFEWIARGVTIRMGGHAFVAQFPMLGDQLRNNAIRGTLSLAWRIGQAVINAQENHLDPISAIASVTAYADYGEGRIIFRGKIAEVNRRTIEGFARGTMRIEGMEEFKNRSLIIDFQNENLIARDDEGKHVATVPDLITVLDSTTGQAITTERLRYGQRVAVIVIPAPSIMKTPEALKIWGPRGFRYDFDYVPL
ncbi:hypothetical protein SAMN00768000_1774 [Sulfobacillus thermosulfidooxidans DSM 9293]|uniref:DUF917 domain-containing protein n=2 Tax=Sulfobacillus thermosulfidooxidans TaxID=28034 RepID=A0A1W1WEG8_SULTA|nr:DUF917 domain-containing protein [Sulfobacillus thermosulfidooxidans]PSR25488.1 MAG: DUF917 domain-containing protein [Sulfobacillus thermosulfidooxidans]SMC04667.1 hypothetical protein SAMN00768000_1774 [Sulfobacillus thermosulfidooxidans DSM 9293]